MAASDLDFPDDTQPCMGKRKALEMDANVVGNVLSCDSPRLDEWFKYNYMYVDKSLFIKEFMSRDGNILFMRPRHFGKTMNMLLLQKFLSIFEEEPEEEFKALKIFQDADFVNEHHRKHPVFFISFASAASRDQKSLNSEIKSCVLKSMEPLKYYLMATHVDDDVLKKKKHQKMVSLLEKMADGLKDVDAVIACFEKMLDLVRDYLDIDPIVLIDEYDAPAHAANNGGFLPRVLDLLRCFYVELTELSHSRVCFAGVLLVAVNKVLGDMNNLAFYDISASDWAADRFSSMFGFTRKEVEELVQKCRENGLSVPTVEELESHYGGYVIGASTHIFSPYSVMCALSQGKLGRYWTAGASGEDIFDFVKGYKSNISLTELVGLTSQDSGTIAAYIDNAPGIVYDRGHLTISHKVLYHCGYLVEAREKTDGKESPGPGRRVILKVPNREVRETIKSDMFHFFSSPGDAQRLTGLLVQGLQEGEFRKAFGFIVARTIFALESGNFSRDERERNYHMAFVLLFKYLYPVQDGAKERHQFYEGSYGSGVADLIVEIPMADDKVLGVIFGFKHAQKEAEMQQWALERVRQVAEKNYLEHPTHISAATRVLLVGMCYHETKTVFCYRFATRTSPSEPFIIDASDAKCCILTSEQGPSTTVQ